MLKQSFFKKAFSNLSSSKLLEKSQQISAQLGQEESQAPVVLAAIAAEGMEADKAKANRALEAEQSAENKTQASGLFERLSKRRAAFGLALLGAGSGFAFTQVAPAALSESLKDTLPGQAAVALLRQAGDPLIEPVAKGNRSLFLTNEIFYRKIEAIAQVPRNPVPTSAIPGAPNSASQPSAKQSTATNPAATKPTATPSKPQQAENVAAAAPPVPQAAPVAYTGTTIDNVLEMRVAVAKDVSAISLATSGNGSLTDLDGNPLKTLSPESSVLAEINGGIMIDGQPMPSVFWVYPEDGGYVAVGDRWYRGRALVALRERGLIAVNYVLLGDYLYSVVGTEVSPDWPAESMKAQAVAARSYALTHNISPASEAYFDLDNTQRFQAYKGISHEANTTQAAVQATSGEFISHDGGIVESLYAASQAIVDDAHKGSGMSQLGAKDLASQGYSYTEILAHYYPETGLGRIETDTD